MNAPYQPPRRTWLSKFAAAFAGIAQGMRGQVSFAVHLLVTVLVIVLAALLRVTLVEWCLLALCIALVLALELLNSALEQIAKAVTREYDEHVHHALDIASGAVLLASLGAALVGAVILLPRVLALLSDSVTS